MQESDNWINDSGALVSRISNAPAKSSVIPSKVEGSHAQQAAEIPRQARNDNYLRILKVNLRDTALAE
jgi:hypothetical protein